MPFKYLITSGCSFTQAGQHRWPVILSEKQKLALFNRGQSGAGNSWISRSVIYQSELLLNQNINPDELLVIVMWSSFDRISLYSEKNLPETISFLKSNPSERQDSDDLRGGFLEGSSLLHMNREKLILENMLPYRLRAIQSYENILRLQWYCQTKNIRLINLSICDIFKYPNYRFLDKEKLGPTTDQTYEDVKHLHNLIDFDKWIFYKKSGGMFEYAANNGLEFEEDGHHPSIQTHQHYVDNFLHPFLKEKGIF